MKEPTRAQIEQQARALFALGDYPAAEQLFVQLVHSAPEDAAAHYNLGVCVAKLNRFEDALACYHHALRLNPGFVDAYVNFGGCLMALNHAARARQAFAIARRLDPENANALLNEGICALALGDYAAGWQGFAARWRLPSYAKFKRVFAQPRWQGENMAGKTLFLYAEQGFGDTIQMARYIPVLITQGATIIIEAPPALVRLLKTIAGSPHIIAQGDTVPEFDYYCAMMDLPLAIGTKVDTIPHNVPYLFAEPAATPRDKKKRIALCWAGRSSHDNDANRSMSFAQLLPLLELPDIDWISLQKRIPERDQAAIQASKVQNLGQDFADFAAAAAAIMSCDLVITVDTSIAHLAGALGKPVWVMLPFAADWRWLMQRSDSPWYPNARLFRQERRGDWIGVIEPVKQALAAF